MPSERPIGLILRAARCTARWHAAFFLMLMLILFNAQIAHAHITVTPQRSTPGASEQYVITVPTERPVPTVKVRLSIPPGVVVYSFGSSTGWQREVTQDSAGNVTAISWSGGLIYPDEFSQFTFLARNPGTGVQLVWKAEQTYQDGLKVSWTGPLSSQQPASITLLSNAPLTDLASVPSNADDNSTVATAGLLVALLALVLSLFCAGLLVLSLRRNVL